MTWPRLFWWTVYAAAFGYVEAAVVVYIRKATGMTPGLDYRAIWRARGVPFNSAGIAAEMSRLGILKLEMTREIATILLLAGAAWAAGRTLREKWGIFTYTFAVWDLTYYLYLFLWIGFPHSLFDADIYFLVPWAWYGPVWVPMLLCMPLFLAVALWLLRPAPIPSAEGDES